jgi:hypothetical protein
MADGTADDPGHDAILEAADAATAEAKSLRQKGTDAVASSLRADRLAPSDAATPEPVDDRRPRRGRR